MKKSIFLFFAAILCAIGMNAAQVTPNGKYFYFKTSSTWNVDGPRYAVYFAWRNGGGEDKTWASCKTVPGTTDILYVTAPGEFWDIYFCRMNGSTTDNKDANVWNKTDKLQYDGSKNFWTKSTGWNGTTTYSTYVPAISSVTLLDNGTNIISGTGTQADPYLVYVETTIKVKGEGTKVLEDPDAKLNYNFKQGTTSKQEGTSATYQFTASATADTEYTINLDGYTKVNTTKSTAKSATTLYYKTVERAEETNTVTISYKCGDKDVQTGITEVVGVSTTSSFTAPTNITGYKFTNWTIGAGITLKAGTASDATITVVTKSASSNYTLVANYEEVMETVYFINTNNWTRVNIHKWNGKAADSSWPGEKLTASGEKIGEYDVYSYTAKQGDYANVIFNSKTSSTDGGNAQTGDLTWTAGKYYIYNYGGKSDWYTKEEAEALLVVPVVEETVYFVNNKKWTKVQAYAWNSTGNNTWPGVALTATGEKVADYDVYSYTAPQGYVNVIFNNKTGENGEQSADFVWKDGKYYCMGADANYAGGTQEDVETIIAEYALAANVYLAGEMTNPDNWDINKKAFKKATADATTATVTVALDAKTYKFKLVVDGAWKGNGGIMKRGENAVHEGGWSFDEDKDCQIVADIAGDYTFTWDLNTKKLTVAYPPLPKHQVNATVNPAETGTVTGMGEYEQGSTATLVATPAANYAFKNWTEDGEVVSTEATYSFKVTKAVELVANFVPEETHEVTISYLCNGTPIPGQAETKLAVGVTTASTISALAITNYKFDSWKVGSGVQAVDATKDPIQIITLASGDYTLAANYTKIELTYNVTVPAGTPACYIAGEMNSWTLTEMTKVDDTHYTITIDGATTAHKYKYACGDSWDYVELKADGSSVDDRTFNAKDVVAKWSKPDTYTIAGTPATVFGKEWDATYTANDMKLQEDGTFVWSVTGLELTKTTNVAFKIVKNQNWDTAYPSDNKTIPVAEDGTYDLTIYFNAAEKDDATKNNGIYISLEKQAVVTPTPDYTRGELTAGKFGTLCLPFGSTNYTGMELFECVGQETGKVYIASVTTLEAGVPYIFLATATELAVYSDGTSAATPGDHNGLHGTFTDNTEVAANDDNHILLNNELRKVAETCWVNANRAYLVMSEVPSEFTKMPGRRYIGMDVEGENEATGFENITNGENTTIKLIENGQLIIIRNGEKFNAMGVKL